MPKTSSIRSSVSIELRLVTDRQTDRQTDGYRAMASTRARAVLLGRVTHLLSVTHTHPFNGPLSGTTWVSRYQRGKPIWILLKQRYSEWQWYQLGHMQLCTSLQTDNHASTPPLSFFTGRVPFLPPNQQRQGTEGKARRCLSQTHTFLVPVLGVQFTIVQ